MMYRLFFEEIATKMYPSTLLHSYGVNGKISGSIGAIGEMGSGVVAVLHAPLGCGFHYRYSARRRHQPFHALFTTDLTEREIIFGGEEKLRQTVQMVWEQYAPRLIVIIPSPVTDILNEDIRAVAEELRREGIPVAGIQSELFSHRDKKYARDRLKELSRLKITGDNKLEIELKGCGFTEAIYALVEQVMEPQERIPRSINIETVGWGSEGMITLREIEAFLQRAGVTVNCWIPSSDVEKLKKAPAAELNLVKRIRWARRMREKFGTEYLHINNVGRYTGLDGIARFYSDIGEKLRMESEMGLLVRTAVEEALEQTANDRERIKKYRCALICRGMQSAPFTLKTYTQNFNASVKYICIRLTEEMRMQPGMTQEVERNLLRRIQDAIELYSPRTEVIMNPDRQEMKALFSQVDAVVGTDDFSLEGLNAPLISASAVSSSLSFESYIRSVHRFLSRLEHGVQRPELLLNRMPFETEHYPRLENSSSAAAREMWERMWLKRDKEAER